MELIDNTADFKPSKVDWNELLLGAGNNKDKKIALPDAPEWKGLCTLDFDPDSNPDIQWDLNNLPLPFEDESFEEIHAYDVLEHLGSQGDWRSFFTLFDEFHRILKPDGHIMAITPCWDSIWAWSDPSHTRIISEGTIHFLDRDNYKQVGKTAMTDFRHFYKGDFSIEHAQEKDERFTFVLKKK